MADTPLSGLPALGAAPASNDLLVVVDVSDHSEAPTGTTKNLTPVNLFTSPPVTGTVPITGGTVTASTPVVDATQTWNNVAVTFTGWKLNVTDTTSAAGSLLVDLQVATVSKFSVGKNGNVTAAGSGTFGGSLIVNAAGLTLFGNAGATNSPTGLEFQNNGGAGDVTFVVEGAAGTTFTGSSANAGVLGTLGAKVLQLGVNSTVAVTINTDLSVSLSGAAALKSGSTSLLNLDSNGIVNLGGNAQQVKGYFGAAFAASANNHGAFGIDSSSSKFFWIDSAGNRVGVGGTPF